MFSTVFRFSVQGPDGTIPGPKLTRLLRNQLLREKTDFLLFKVLRVDTVSEWLDLLSLKTFFHLISLTTNGKSSLYNKLKSVTQTFSFEYFSVFAAVFWTWSVWPRYKELFLWPSLDGKPHSPFPWRWREQLRLVWPLYSISK